MGAAAPPGSGRGARSRCRRAGGISLYSNLHELICGSRRYADSGQCYLGGVAYCEEHDLGIYLSCLQGVRTAEAAVLATASPSPQ